MSTHQILLISHGHFEKEFLERIRLEIQHEFGIPVEIRKGYTDISPHYDPARRQYDATQLLKIFDSGPLHKAVKTIGLFHVDLFIPILTFLFGQAIYKGKTGVASTYRLRNEQYGLPRNEKLLFERFLKVIVHELGHSFGLKHCYNSVCVMRSTTYVEDIDQKQHHFCASCHRELQNLISADDSEFLSE